MWHASDVSHARRQHAEVITSYLAFSKGLLRQCRRALGLYIASGMRCHFRWASSEWSAADYASLRWEPDVRSKQDARGSKPAKDSHVQ